jgi:hypothetical protein
VFGILLMAEVSAAMLKASLAKGFIVGMMG